MNYNSKVIKHFVVLIFYFETLLSMYIDRNRQKMKIKVNQENQVEWRGQVSHDEFQHFQHFLVVRYSHGAIVNIR